MMEYLKKTQLGKQAITYGDQIDDVQESVLQCQCEELLEYYKLKYWRMPDSLTRYISTRAPIQYRKIVSRYFAGKPDFTILLPSGRFLNIELKIKKGKLTGGQKRFARQYETFIIRSLDDFEKLIIEKLENKE